MDKLKFIAEQMESIQIPYEYLEWTSNVIYPYFVGEITEQEPSTEDGAEHSTALITGFYRGGGTALLDAQAKIKKHFNPIYGQCAHTEHGSIAVFYAGAFMIPSGEADLQKMQINLTIKEWKDDV
jgi:hypothetical protein